MCLTELCYLFTFDVCNIISTILRLRHILRIKSKTALIHSCSLYRYDSFPPSVRYGINAGCEIYYQFQLRDGRPWACTCSVDLLRVYIQQGFSDSFGSCDFK